MRFFEDVYSDPSNWEENPPPRLAQPAIESYATSSLDDHDAEPDENVEADIVEPEVSQPTTRRPEWPR
jgi:hypothetical protein